jgi:hypothetical protein
LSLILPCFVVQNYTEQIRIETTQRVVLILGSSKPGYKGNASQVVWIGMKDKDDLPIAGGDLEAFYRCKVPYRQFSPVI